MHNSVWTDNSFIPEFESLTGDKKTDVLIIGGGIAGILCAFYLKKAGVDYILVEGSRILSGITKNTTAKITCQHGLIYNKLINYFGKEKAKMYLTANLHAIEQYKKLCKEIDCDFEEKSAYTYSLTDKAVIEYEVDAVNSLGFDAHFVMPDELPFKTEGAIRVDNQAQFNPLKFLGEIAKDLNIYENTFIRDITPDTAISDTGKITAKKIIVTTHYPFINKHGNYFIKLYQHRSYVSAYENAPAISGMYVDESLKGMSFRTYNDMLLIGGGGHRTGKMSGAWQEIDVFTKRYYPHAKSKYQWATQDCISLDGVPYIGQYSKSTPNLYVASGFNKWGMTSAMVSAKILVGMITDNTPDYSEVFSPHRGILKPQLLVNGFETAANFITPTTKRCPHLGCALKWNKYEHSWDCPCHGSRFEKDGKLIDNPSTGDANI